jgi:hypothetical protein
MFIVTLSGWYPHDEGCVYSALCYINNTRLAVVEMLSAMPRSVWLFIMLIFARWTSMFSI